jgi:hypothetical protein
MCFGKRHLGGFIMYQIRYALGGGFGGAEKQEWEDCPEAVDLDDAIDIAYGKACEEYEMYDGLYGLRNIEMIVEEDEVDESEAQSIWEEERESWLDYEAREV